MRGPYVVLFDKWWGYVGIALFTMRLGRFGETSPPVLVPRYNIISCCVRDKTGGVYPGTNDGYVGEGHSDTWVLLVEFSSFSRYVPPPITVL